MTARRVLFAIRNPEARNQPGLAKAIQVARALGASLELFHALADPLFIELERFWDDNVDKLRERVEGEARIPLVRLCAVARKHGVEAGYSVKWDYPPHEAVVRRASSIGASLIVAECHKIARARAWQIHLSDWELLRTSPVPVLLLKSGKPYRRPLMLAAVDPAHTHAKPGELDNRIVSTGAELGKGLRGALHIMHAGHPSIVTPAFEVFRASVGVPPGRAHLVDGNPAIAIPRLAGKLGAEIVVMGVVSRSALQRVLIGNTAERVLASLACDVLVVKPGSFESRVAQENRDTRMPPPAAPSTIYS